MSNQLLTPANLIDALPKKALTRRPRKVPLWLPYLQTIKETRKGVFEFVYNGGEETAKADEILSIMIYGEANTQVDTRTLSKVCGRGIPIVIHRRNIPRPIFITAGPRADPDDTLSAHLIQRSHSRVSTHIARQLLIAKMASMTYLLEPLPLPDFADVDKLRNIEAVHAKKYWDAWFTRLGHPEWHRRSRNPAAETLDAVSKFLSGITLRWITYHNLSPYHGFLHTPTDYPTLIYDLLEPYRGYADFIVLQTLLGTEDEKLWVPRAIAAIKGWLNTQDYVPLTRQIVTHQELFHGIVLSLKYYLLGRQRKFHIPMPGKPKGGRPAKVEFKLYGRHAGKTDFWKVAHYVADEPIPVDLDTLRDIGPLVEPEPAPSEPEAGKNAERLPGKTIEDTVAPVYAKTTGGRVVKATPKLPKDYCVIDVETTGLVADHDHIIELAALRIRDSEVVGEFSTLVQSPVPLNEMNRELTGLTDEDLKTGRAIGDALSRFCDFVGSDLLVGHNIGFDLRFIGQALYDAKMPLLTPTTIDTRAVSRKLMPGRGSYRLPDIADDLGIDCGHTHRALDDCRTAQELVRKLYFPDEGTAKPLDKSPLTNSQYAGGP